MTKGLHMIRHLHAAGWRVVVTDYTKWNMAMGQFSTGCSRFQLVADPSQDPEGPDLSQPLQFWSGIA